MKMTLLTRLLNYLFGKKDKMIHLILFGPPGSGKGTQAAFLIETFDLVHISTGDLFRHEIGNNTPLGKEAKAYTSKGELVPDSVTIGMLKNKVAAHPDAKGFIYDGFPRTTIQAEALDAMLSETNAQINCLISLTVDDEEIVHRIKNRGLTSGRADDLDESIIRNRIEVYKENTLEVYDYYLAKGKAKEIAGIGTIEDIASRLQAAVKATL